MLSFRAANSFLLHTEEFQLLVKFSDVFKLKENFCGELMLNITVTFKELFQVVLDYDIYQVY